MFNKLRLKITLGTAFILGGFLFALGMHLINSQKAQLTQNLQEHGERIASLAARSSAEYIQRFSFFLMEDQAISIEQSPNIAFCEIYNAEGKSLLQSGNIISEDHEGKRRASYGSDIMVVTQSILADDGLVLGSVEVGLRLDSIDEAIRQKTTDMALLIIGFTICIILVINLFLHRMIIGPLLTLVDGAQRLANREFLILDDRGRADEIGLLTKKFNEMSEVLEELYTRLEGKVQERTLELQQANEELKAAAERAREMAAKAEAGALAKSQFLASMSHEIRTPMNAVLGMGDVLNNSSLDAEQRRYVRILLEAGNALMGLINDILDLSKIEAGEMEFENAPFNLEQVIDKAFKVTVHAGHQKGLDLDYSIASGVPLNLCGDAHRLQQILINIIGNGIKFTDEGYILLDIAVDHGRFSDEEQVVLHFCIRDSGIGIPMDKLDSIFEKFTQADASTTRRHGGTGLGLSICRHLCEKLGGDIWIESEQGGGCAAHFRIPYGIASSFVGNHTNLNNKRMLIVDSRVYAQKTLGGRLLSAGAQVDWAVDLDSFDALLAYAGSVYDGVIIGALSSVECMDTVQRMMRSYNVDGEKIVWLRSCNASQYGDKPVMGATVTMPPSLKDIDGALSSRAYESANDQASQGEGVSPSSNEINILLVEDSEANSMLIELYLKDSKHRLLIASNGEDALSLYKDEPVDLVFMDVEMPVMDGLECTRLLRRWEQDNGVEPANIVALTAHALVEIKEAALTAGCDDFLTKPVTRKDLLQVVERVSNSQSNIPASAQRLA